MLWNTEYACMYTMSGKKEATVF